MIYDEERLEGEHTMIVPTEEGRVIIDLDNGRARLGQGSWVILSDMTGDSWTGYGRNTVELWAVELWDEVIITLTADVVSDEWHAAHKEGVVSDIDPLVALAKALDQCSEYSN